MHFFSQHGCVGSCATLLLNLNLPLAGAAARVIRACLWLRAVRSQGGGGDRHAAPTGAAFISLVCLLSESMSSSDLEVTVPVCVPGGGERAEHWEV